MALSPLPAPSLQAGKLAKRFSVQLAGTEDAEPVHRAGRASVALSSTSGAEMDHEDFAVPLPGLGSSAAPFIRTAQF